MSTDLLTSWPKSEITIWTLLNVIVCLFIQPQFVSFISFRVAYFRKCFETPFTISVGACQLPECYCFASRVVGCIRKEHKKICTVPTGRGCSWFALPSCDDVRRNHTDPVKNLNVSMQHDYCVGCPYSRYCGTSRNRTCSDDFHQRSYETESRAYDWHISATKWENWKILVLVCVVRIRIDDVWWWVWDNQHTEACLYVVFRTLYVLMCAR